MADKIRPLYDYIGVRPDEEKETTTDSGIILAKQVVTKTARGTIVAVGSGVKTESGDLMQLMVSVDDKIIYKKYSAVEIEKDFVLIQEKDILAVIESK